MKNSVKLSAALVTGGLFLSGLVYAPHVFATSQPAPQSATVEKAEAQDDAAVLASATVTAEQARTAAQQAYPGSKVSSASIEDENGTPTFAVLVTVDGKELDVKVNALTGKVVRADNGGRDEAGSEND